MQYFTENGNICARGEEALPMTRDEAEILDEQLAREAHRRAVGEAAHAIVCRLCRGTGHQPKETKGFSVCPPCHGIGMLPATQDEYEVRELEDALHGLREALTSLAKLERWAGIVEDARIFCGVIERELAKAKASKAVAA